MSWEVSKPLDSLFEARFVRVPLWIPMLVVPLLVAIFPQGGIKENPLHPFRIVTSACQWLEDVTRFPVDMWCCFDSLC